MFELRARVMGVFSGWKYHVHMHRIKRSTVLKSQQLDLDMLGYMQPALTGKWRLFSMLGQWRLWKEVLWISIFSWKSSTKFPQQTTWESHVWGEKWERCFLQLAGRDDLVWRKRCQASIISSEHLSYISSHLDWLAVAHTDTQMQTL